MILSNRPCYITLGTINLLHRKFPSRYLHRSYPSRGRDNNWPPRSCDLTPPDLFLWLYVKDKVYDNNLKSIPELKDNVRSVISETELHLYEHVLQNVDKMMVACKRKDG
ncbi:hypothetical protein WN55_04309 [Dufourea novaeangliae]|uniref:Histone-lysine N-methyltransferase SETMAR n=1 Tax=Dufourea novaeangliae TaxID=178035 RepID=A0A154PLP7_DUFNO|nr:hypothetical protein WN55_04309 [Dufourea novaeangliae]